MGVENHVLELLLDVTHEGGNALKLEYLDHQRGFFGIVMRQPTRCPSKDPHADRARFSCAYS